MRLFFKILQGCLWGALIFYPSTTHARMLAVVIGVSEYEKDSGIRSLPFVQNDAGRIAYTLKEGGNFEVYPLYATKNGSDSPTKQNIETTLRQVLSPDVCHPDDTVVVYFSGHGTISSRDKEKTLLLARDSIFHKEDTALSAQWIREQLKKCPARHKLFLLDTCHSGGKRSALTQLASSLVEGGEEGVITLASCKIHQKSKTWEEKSMSFFTYWLNEGLKGYADSDQDGWVGTDELFDYIHRNLERTQKIWPHHQKPVMVTTRSTAHFRVIRPRPRDLQSVLDDFADQIVTQMELLDRHYLYVRPWSPPADVSASFSDLNHWKSTLDYCQRELQRLIDAKTAGKGFSRVNQPTVASAVHLKSQLSPAEKDSQGREIYFLSALLEIPGVAENPDKIQMRVYKRHTDETYEPPYLPVGESPVLASSSDKRRVQIEVKTPDGRFIPRPFQQIHGVTYVALNAGEVYRVVVQDPDIDREPVGLRLLVDGQNTLPQYLPYVEEKYGIVEAAPEESPEAESDGAGKRDLSATSLEEVSYRPHVRLDHARYWIMQKPVPYYFHGFYRQAGLESRYGEFTVSPTVRTESSHQGFPREMGLITVAFYHLQRTRGAEQDVMTVPGKENPHSLFVVEGYELGSLRECLQIRYASSASLQAAIKK